MTSSESMPSSLSSLVTQGVHSVAKEHGLSGLQLGGGGGSCRCHPALPEERKLQVGREN